MSDERAIGVFDSGVGGLTVARAIFDLLPHEPILYVGDNGRFPYGPRPLEEIRAFGLEIAGYLVERDVKMLVVACNSIEVAAIADLAQAHGVPVVGIIDPGVRAAVRATRNGRCDGRERPTLLPGLPGLRRARGGGGHLERRVAGGRSRVS
jgi:glutamate racemase